MSKPVQDKVKAFVAFHRANPEVYRLFTRFAAEAMAAGHKRMSADAIMHRVRWETDVVTRGAGGMNGKGLKINNNHIAYYARLYASESGNNDFFTFREIKK